METDIFAYSDVRAAWTEIVRKKENGYKIALVGYSLGNTTITYLQRYLEVDLLLAISESSLGRNHPIKKENTRRSVLWYGPDFLSNAGLKDGFDKINYVDAFHLWMNVHPRVVNGVLGELKDLVQLEQNEGSGLGCEADHPPNDKRRSSRRCRRNRSRACACTERQRRMVTAAEPPHHRGRDLHSLLGL
jgi:hypothetical protein